MEDPKVNGVLALQLVILEILDFMGQEWSKNQIDQCAELAYTEYYWFTIGELKQFTMRVKSGQFGKIYGKFAPAHLMEYLLDYSNEMWKARADYFGKAKPVAAPVEETPMTEAEMAQQDRFFKHLIKLAEKLSVKKSDAIALEDAARDERMETHLEFFKRHMTPEQKEEAERRREEIRIAAKEYEEGKR